MLVPESRWEPSGSLSFTGQNPLGVSVRKGGGVGGGVRGGLDVPTVSGGDAKTIRFRHNSVVRRCDCGGGSSGNVNGLLRSMTHFVSCPRLGHCPGPLPTHPEPVPTPPGPVGTPVDPGVGEWTPTVPLVVLVAAVVVSSPDARETLVQLMTGDVEMVSPPGRNRPNYPRTLVVPFSLDLRPP